MASLPQPAARLRRFDLNPFAALGQRITALNAAGKDVIRLDAGSPDLPPPAEVIDALAKSAANPTYHGYANYRGEPGFRKAVSDYYRRRFGVELDPNTEILGLIGSKEGIVNLSLAYLDAGDAAIVPSIAYPTYRAGALMAGAETITIDVRPETGYLPNFDQPLPGIEKAKLLWVNYPNNPTGAVAPLEFYERALQFCREHNLLLCSDNPYCEVCFGDYRAPSALQVSGAKDQAVEFISTSKTYNMAGWRLGAVVGNREALNTLLHVKSTGDSGHFRVIHDAGTVAINSTPDSWIAARNQRYAERRDRILETLPDIGLQADRPHGSLYVWARILHGMTDREYVESALVDAGVSLTPGTVYGPEGVHYIRFSLGISETRLTEAMNRLKEWYRVHA